MKNIQVPEFIENVKNNLLQVNYFLKQHYKNYFDITKHYLYRQPWCLLIGPEKSGKTSLFQNTELNLLQCQAANNSQCNTWFNSNAVFFEVPGRENSVTACTELFREVKRFGRKNAFDCVIVTLNIYDFLAYSPQELNEQTQKIATFVKQMLLSHAHCELDIYLTFTNLDRIAGFTAFFGELGNKDRQQAWGYQFSQYNTIEHMLDQHHDKYNQLLRNMHDQLINRLHRSRNSSNSSLIREFPVQIESLQQSVKALLAKIAEIQPGLYKIKGVFFTSSRQTGTCHDRITASISKSYELVVKADLPQASRDQPFFIDGMLKTIYEISAKDKHSIPGWIKPTSYAASIFAVLLTGGIISHYIKSSESLSKASFELEKFNQLQQTASHGEDISLDTLIPSLKYLSRASNHLNQANTWIFPFNNIKFIRQEINTAYQDTLSQDFLPLLTKEMEQELLSTKNSAQKYFTLKAYLMLGEPQQLDINYLKNWLQQHWQNKSSSKSFASSIKLLESSVAQPYRGISLKPNLIKQTRETLNNLPLNYLLYMLIKDNPIKNGIVINNNTVPYIYTRDGYLDYAENIIPRLIMQFQNEKWILKNPNSNTYANQQVISQVTQLYTNDYSNWWQLFTLHIQPPTFDTIAQAQKYFSQVLKQSLPISDMITVLQNNTRAFDNPNKWQNIFNQQIAANFANINLMASSTLNYIAPAFNDMNQFFNTLAAAKNPDEICFNVAKSRFLNPFQTDPINQLLTLSQKTSEPINNWLKSVASNSWILVLQHAQNYINQQWKNELFSEYQNNISQRYPIINNSSQEIALDNFNHFFAKNGSLEKFFENYLKPFLDTNQPQWLPKQVSGISLPFARDNILELERANVIRQMFFANNSETANVNFSLKSLAYETSINNTIVNINGQTFTSERGNHKKFSFTWPSKFQLYPTTITIQSINGKQYQISESGAWGWFKLLTRANVNPTGNNTQNFQVSFDINGMNVKYLITSEEQINPFIPDILQQFVLPEKIVG